MVHLSPCATTACFLWWPPVKLIWESCRKLNTKSCFGRGFQTFGCYIFQVCEFGVERRLMVTNRIKMHGMGIFYFVTCLHVFCNIGVLRMLRSLRCLRTHFQQRLTGRWMLNGLNAVNAGQIVYYFKSFSHVNGLPLRSRSRLYDFCTNFVLNDFLSNLVFRIGKKKHFTPIPFQNIHSV